MKTIITIFLTLLLGSISLLSCSNDDDGYGNFSGLAFAEENAECRCNEVTSTHIATDLTKCTMDRYSTWCVLIKSDEQPQISRSEEWAYNWKLYKDTEKRNLWHLHLNIPNAYDDLKNTFTISNSHGTITWDFFLEYSSMCYDFSDQEPIYCWDVCDPYLVYYANATAHTKVNGNIESTACYIYTYPRDGKLYVSGVKSDNIHKWGAYELTRGEDPWGYSCSYYADVDGTLVYIKL